MVYRDRWLGLSRISEALLTVMLSHYGSVACYDELLAAGWPEGDRKREVLRVRLAKLRDQLGPLGLQIRVRVTTGGTVLEVL